MKQTNKNFITLKGGQNRDSNTSEILLLIEIALYKSLCVFLWLLM